MMLMIIIFVLTYCKYLNQKTKGTIGQYRLSIYRVPVLFNSWTRNDTVVLHSLHCLNMWSRWLFFKHVHTCRRKYFCVMNQTDALYACVHWVSAYGDSHVWGLEPTRCCPLLCKDVTTILCCFSEFINFSDALFIFWETNHNLCWCPTALSLITASNPTLVSILQKHICSSTQQTHHTAKNPFKTV